jgi:hypothetical protein
MKHWKSWLAVTATAAFASACTVTTSSDDSSSNDDNDVTIDEQKPFSDDATSPDDDYTFTSLGDAGVDAQAPGPTPEPTSDDTTSPTTTEPSDGGTDTTTSTSSESSETDASTTPTDQPTMSDATGSTSDSDGGMTTSMGPGPNPNPDCMLPEADPPSCEACLADSCEMEYTACGCDPDCAAQLLALKECYEMKNTVDNPSAMPEDDWNACLDEVGGENASDKLYDVLSCAGDPYMPPADSAGEDPYNRVEGDSNCTLACFALYSFDF